MLKLKGILLHYVKNCFHYAYVTIFATLYNVGSVNRDSDLEAFSHYLTDDSFATLIFQLIAKPNI